MQGMRYLIITATILSSLSGFTCEIYQGDLSLNFQCLRQEVRQLTSITNQPQDLAEKKMILAEQGLDSNQEEIKVIQ